MFCVKEVESEREREREVNTGYAQIVLCTIKIEIEGRFFVSCVGDEKVCVQE